MRFVMHFTDEHRERGQARRIGVSVQEYRARKAAGQHWCSGCRNWHDASEFGANRANAHGLQWQCRDWRRRYQRVKYRKAA